MTNVPSVFRLTIEVADLGRAVTFYAALLGVEGRLLPGSRAYFTAGPVTLQVLDVSGHKPVTVLPKALYFVVDDLDAVFARARGLDCLATDDVHGSPAGAISVKPWGERSFYVDDPWGNPLGFVEAGTVYDGSR